MMVPARLQLHDGSSDKVTYIHSEFLPDQRDYHISQSVSVHDRFSEPQYQINKYDIDQTLSARFFADNPFLLDTNTTLLASGMDWSGAPPTEYSDPSMSSFYDHSPVYTVQQAAYTPGVDVSSVYSSAPAWQDTGSSRMTGDYALGEESFFYSPKQPSTIAATESPKIEHFTQDGSRDFGRLSISRSPTADNSSPSPPNTLSYKVSDEVEEDDSKAQIASDDRTSDEPYAKLIYRALLNAPGHSMALQDIYQWFIDNTDKGSSSSSGWRNSIRHNLSMNAAFRKTERQSSGDETKKTSEWVLEPFAIKNGVTPTTRYRKTGKKAVKSDNPMPSRQISGRKGGMCAKSKSYKPKGKEEHQDVALRTGRQGGRRSHGRLRRSMHSDHRHVSPPTPLPVSDMLEPCTTKSPPVEDILESTDYVFSDVNGIYSGDTGPIFTHEAGPHYGDNHALMWPVFYNEI